MDWFLKSWQKNTDTPSGFAQDILCTLQSIYEEQLKYAPHLSYGEWKILQVPGVTCYNELEAFYFLLFFFFFYMPYISSLHNLAELDSGYNWTYISSF